MDLTTYALLKQQIGNTSSFTEEDAAKLNKVIQDVEELSGQTVNKEEFAEMLKSLVDANDNDKIDTIEEIANWISGEESRLSDKANTTDLAQVAFSGDYNDLINIPEQISQNQYATETWVSQQIAAIPDELPSGGSTGDFLCKTASGVAWATVPLAEDNTFGGGS